jgi:hypothetical protein
MQAFLAHANACPPCRSEYDAEASTKRLIVMRAPMVETPASVQRAILERIASESAVPPAPSRVPGFLTSLRIRPSLAYAFGLVALIIIIAQFVQPPARVAIAGGNNVLLQSMENYKAVMAGSITPQVASSDPSAVLKLFEGATTFPVHVPRLRNCTLVGGVLNDHHGIPLAHVVYRQGETLVYMYQACWNTVQEGTNLMVPEGVMESLRKTGWYTETLAGGQTVALWVRGQTLCAAVADVGRDELVACVTSEESPVTSVP